MMTGYERYGRYGVHADMPKATGEISAFGSAVHQLSSRRKRRH